jgi:soluble lytic murein transglycosylase-like protein
MNRVRLALLALFAAILVFDAAPRVPQSALGPNVSGPTRVLGEPEIAAQLRELNPALSLRQLRRIAAAVVKYSAKYDLDPELVTAVMRVESSARPWVRSPKGAMGLMQVMPHMIGPLDVAGNPSSIESNIEVGCMILADNIRRLGEDDGILSYFWGSEIRGVSYLERVREARAAIRRPAES